MEYYLAIKTNEVLMHYKHRDTLKTTVLSERSWTQHLDTE